MNNSQLNIVQLLTNPAFKEFQSYGLIDEIALRNIIIQSEYKHLRRTQTQINSIFQLTERFGLSFDAIHHILFRHRPKKHAYLPNLYQACNKPLPSLY